jgi:2-dehydro-3-deoxyphosphogluconate aldolase / (4S)-4-hydroxy-2-oxoglutarate aldolase
MASSVRPRQSLPGAIARTRLIAVLRAPVTTHLTAVAVALHEAGVTCIEVTLTTPNALTLVAELRGILGDSAEIGAGTVLTVGDLEGACAAGASYTLAPSLDLAVLDRAHDLGCPHIPGAATPTEVATAWAHGAAAVKVFPAAQLGGPSYLRALRDPLPQVHLIPTGGVNEVEMVHYLQSGAVAVGVGGPLTQRALIDGPDEEFHDRAKRFVELARDAEVER